MLPGLRDAGVESVVVTLYARDEGVERQVVDGGFEVRRLAARGAAGRARELRRIVRAERPDLVHTTIFEASLAGRLAAARTGIPVLTSLVSILYSGGRAADPNLARWRLAAAGAADAWTGRRMTAHFHAISHAVKRAAVQAMRLDPDRVTVIERGRDPERLGAPSPERRRRARASLDVADDAEVLVHVGRQEPPKGHRYLIEAVGRLAPARPRLVALLAGRTGHATPDVERALERSGVGDRVRFLGHRDDLPEVLAAGDVFVFPSLWEGLGGALIEAMALGLPVVASDLEATREVLEEGRNALLAPPKDAEALAYALATLLDDPDRRRAFGEASRRRFEERFTVDRSTARMLDLYRTIVEPAERRP